MSPDVLQQVRLPLIDLSVCNQTAWYDGEIDDSMVCAGYEHGGRDTCQVTVNMVPCMLVGRNVYRYCVLL